MMSEAAVLKAIETDLRQSAQSRVIYLEGVTDLEPFFGLLGVPVPTGRSHQGTLVKTWNNGGAEVVRRHVQTARTHGIPGIYGIVDGDGQDWSAVSQQFDLPYAGPLFVWKGYSIESLLPRVGWPASWLAEPNWIADLEVYLPTAALNVLYRRLRTVLESLDLYRFSNPGLVRPLRTANEIEIALQAGQANLTERNLADDFRAEWDTIRAAFSTGLAEGLCHLNGKWLIEHLVPFRLGHSSSRRAEYRTRWSQHASDVGGLSEVRDLWQRITGSPP